jgi:hypothetical protein
MLSQATGIAVCSRIGPVRTEEWLQPKALGRRPLLPGFRLSGMLIDYEANFKNLTH